MTPNGEQSIEDKAQMYCRTCRRALHRQQTPTGVESFIHAADLHGGASDHRPEPVPLGELPDPLMECDFCSRPEVAWIYTCADQQTDRNIVTTRRVGTRDYRDRHQAARSLSVQTAPGPSQRWGQQWTACEGCATRIEQRDIYGLISRVTDALPAKYTRGKRLLRVRGELHTTYRIFLDTLQPGRARITP